MIVEDSGSFVMRDDNEEEDPRTIDAEEIDETIVETKDEEILVPGDGTYIRKLTTTF